MFDRLSEGAFDKGPGPGYLAADDDRLGAETDN
jgi:hypothetical protein